MTGFCESVAYRIKLATSSYIGALNLLYRSESFKTKHGWSEVSRVVIYILISAVEAVSL